MIEKAWTFVRVLVSNGTVSEMETVTTRPMSRMQFLESLNSWNRMGIQHSVTLPNGSLAHWQYYSDDV